MHSECPNDPALHCLLRLSICFLAPSIAWLDKDILLLPPQVSPRVGNDIVGRHLEIFALQEPDVSLPM